MLDVLIKQSIYLAAILVWRIPESEQVPNLLQRPVFRLNRTLLKIFSSNGKELFGGGQATLKLTLECAVALRIDLSDANLSHANLVDAKLAGARLQGTNFSAANCYKADLSNADLRGAILHDTVLVGSDLRGADLRNADLTGARIERSSVFCATLVGAIMPRPKRSGRVKRWSDPF